MKFLRDLKRKKADFFQKKRFFYLRFCCFVILYKHEYFVYLYFLQLKKKKSDFMYEILDKIEKPENIKNLSRDEINLLAGEIREFLIDSVSKTGGHLASNLGVVELTIALLKTFDVPNDKIVFDVGHQSYVYKLLTGRKDKMNTLRQFGGIAGFPKRSESDFDSFNTGHASTSISAALGLSEADSLNNSDNFSIAVIGDGALSGGMSLEALGNVIELKNKCIIVLNDNNMSISKSVGGFSYHLNKLRTSSTYRSFKSRFENKFSTTKAGKRFVLFLKAVKDKIRHLISGQTFFENIGLTYFGPIDGHDVGAMSLMLERAKKINAPVLLHVVTKKGKGYEFAEKHPDIYHGVSTFEASKCIESNDNVTYSRVAGNTLCDLAKDDKDIAVVTAAMAAGTGTDEFCEKYPDRFYDVGIAEQHAVTFAAGLAAGGKKPFVVIYSSFLQRSYDQIMHDVCLQNLNVTFLIDRAGIVGEDGETHHGLFDIGFMSQMPNMLVLAPANYEEFTQMIKYASSGNHSGPIAIRYPRGKQQFICDNAPDFCIGVPHIISGGKDVCILSSGTMAETAVSVAERLAAVGKTATVVNLRTLYPLNCEFLSDMAFRHSLVVTLEDGSITGGIGEKIGAYIATLKNRSKCINIGYPSVVTHGSCEKLARHYGLDSITITDELLKYLN